MSLTPEEAARFDELVEQSERLADKIARQFQKHPANVCMYALAKLLAHLIVEGDTPNTRDLFNSLVDDQISGMAEHKGQH